MFIPIRTDRRLKKTPWLNYALIAANVFIFLWTRDDILNVFSLMARGLPLEQIAGTFPVASYMLTPSEPLLKQFISYQFLHAGWEHLLGNMIFLYVFGNSVEDRIGKLGYLGFYLAGGILAGLGHAMVELAPVLGASGAVAAVSGAYLVLFPLSNVTIVYWFIFIGAFEVSSIMLILFQIAQDAVMYVAHFGGVAYLAHLSGYAFGFAVGMALLRARLLPREPCDLLTMLEHRRRRAQFAALTRKGYTPWSHEHGTGKPAKGKDTTLSAKDQRLMQLRQRVTQAIDAHKLDDAAGHYTELLAEFPDQVMSQQHQLDLANQLTAAHHYDTAARAYELFLGAYPGYGQREQIQLMLALIYARYMDRKPQARELLEQVMPRIQDHEQRQLAEQVLRDITV